MNLYIIIDVFVGFFNYEDFSCLTLTNISQLEN